MNNKFLDKVCDQIISETRVIDDLLHTPFSSSLPHFFSSPSLPLVLFSSHCKEVYSLNEQETVYVWKEYKEGITALMEKKEPSHQEKG